MINLKSNNGITIIMLIITIVVLLIITGVTITLSIDSIDNTIDSQDKSEMLIIQHAIQERYIAFLETTNKGLLVGEYNETEDNYKISSNGQLSSHESRTYYVDDEDLYYLNTNNDIIKLEGYVKAIKNHIIDENGKITNNSDVRIDYFFLLGITGEGVTNSEFIVKYKTGYVEKVGSSTTPLQAYNKDSNGNTTSNIINP